MRAGADEVVSNIAKYGNTSAGSVPIAMAEAVEEGASRRGIWWPRLASARVSRGLQPSWMVERERERELVGVGVGKLGVGGGGKGNFNKENKIKVGFLFEAGFSL